jgi:hypothetical protein
VLVVENTTQNPAWKMLHVYLSALYYMGRGKVIHGVTLSLICLAFYFVLLNENLSTKKMKIITLKYCCFGRRGYQRRRTAKNIMLKKCMKIGFQKALFFRC